MRYLITGGCGFLGSNLASAALCRGEELVLFDDLSRYGAAANLEWLRGRGDFQFIHGDIRNANDVELAVQRGKPDVVFHLAGQVAMTTSLANPRLDFEVNALGTFLLLDSLRRLSSQATVIYASSNKVYGDLEWVRYEEQGTRFVALDYVDGFPEDLPFAPESPYGVSKGTGDLYMRDFAKMYGLRTIVFRHSSMYGGRQFATTDQGWVGWFAERALAAARGECEEVTISGTGKQVRDILHVDDLASLYFLAAEGSSSISGEVFNIGGGRENSLSLLELFDVLADVTGARLSPRHLEPRPGDQRVFIANYTKAYERFGWRPTVSAREGLARMLDWLRDPRKSWFDRG